MVGTLKLRYVLFWLGTLAHGCGAKVGGSLQFGGRNGLINRGATNDEAIAYMAFKLCNTDLNAGLSWEEAEACEVRLSWSELWNFLVRQIE